MDRYDEDFDKCVENGKRMPHLGQLSRIYELKKLRSKNTAIERRKKYYKKVEGVYC